MCIQQHDTTVYIIIIIINTYTGIPLQVLGVMQATVLYNQQSATLPLVVIAGTGASFMGRNWLEKIVLNWNRIHTVNADQLQAVLTQYSEVFKPELGAMRNFKAKIFVDPSVPSCFCKARLVSYAMKPLVEAEHDELVDQGILTLVQHADWTTPILCQS